MSYQPTANERINKLTLQLVQRKSENDKIGKKNKDLEKQVTDLKKTKTELQEQINTLKKERADIMHEKQLLEEKNRDLIATGGSNNNLDLEMALQNEVKECKDKITELNSSLNDKKCYLALKDNQIVGYKQINDDLQSKNANLGIKVNELLKSEADLKEKLNVLEIVAGAVRKEEGEQQELVVVKSKSEATEDAKKEIALLKQQLEKCNKENSILNDKLSQNIGKIASIDAFYKEILDGKDQTIKEYCTIVSNNDSEDSTLVKRLLIKFRSEQELKAIKDLRDSLLKEKASQANLAVQTSGGEHNVNGSGTRTENKITPNRTVDGGSVPPPVNGASQRNEANKKTNRLCRDGRLCQRIGQCNFQHDVINKKCRFGLSCKKVEKCLFMHSNVQHVGESAGFGSVSNINPGLMNTWPPMPMLGAHGERTVGLDSSSDMANRRNGLFGNVPVSGNYYGNYYGGANDDYHHHHHQLNNMFSQFNRGQTDRSQYVRKKGLCRNGQKCNVQGCSYHHSPIHRQCRNGDNCANKDTTCLFGHESKNE